MSASPFPSVATEGGAVFAHPAPLRVAPASITGALTALDRKLGHLYTTLADAGLAGAHFSRAPADPAEPCEPLGHLTLAAAAPALRDALAALIAVRPENADDEDDPEHAAAWRFADATLALVSPAPDAAARRAA